MLSAQEKITKLEGLLGRIRKNVALPRAALRAEPVAAVPAVAEPPVTPSPVPEPVAEVDRMSLDRIGAAPRLQVAAEEEIDLEELEEELEVEATPAPPPELPPTGPRAAAAGLAEPSFDDAGTEALEAELPSAPSRPAPLGHQGPPKAEQLGKTVELRGSDAGAELLELDTAAATKPTSREEMEAALPRGEFHGGYDESLAPPPEAAQELEAHRRRVDAAAAAARDARRVATAAPTGAKADTVLERRAIPAGTRAVQTTPRAAAAAAPTFVALLDGSLKL